MDAIILKVNLDYVFSAELKEDCIIKHIEIKRRRMENTNFYRCESSSSQINEYKPLSIFLIVLELP